MNDMILGGKINVFGLDTLDFSKTTVEWINKIYTLQAWLMRYLFPTIVIYLFIKGFNVQCLITKAVIMTGEIRNTNEEISQRAYHPACSKYSVSISQIKLD